jgi:6-phosphogluconolactonase (cycloisomerase 2 family)
VHGLSADDTGPAQVAFTRSGDHLVVTEKSTALIDVFTLDDEGRADGHQMFQSPAPPPFGFAAGRHDRLFVTQANGGAANPGGGSVSSYEVTDDGALTLISDSVPTHQTAACWLVLSQDERFAYSANTPSDSISSFSVGRDGTLELLESEAGSTGLGSNPVDMALSRDGRFLYTLNSGTGTIGAFWVHPRTGGLRALTAAGSLPAGANGLAAQ